jgi:hypothetical protein
MKDEETLANDEANRTAGGKVSRRVHFIPVICSYVASFTDGSRAAYIYDPAALYGKKLCLHHDHLG